MSNDRSMRLLNAADIFNADDAKALEFVPCPEWGHVSAPDGTDPSLVDEDGTLLEAYTDAEGKPKKRRVSKGVYCRALTVKERGVARKTASQEVSDGKGGTKTVTDMEMMECLMVTQCAVDGEGRPIFKPIDYEKLLEKAGGPVNRIAKKAMVMSGMLLDEDDLGN